MLEEMFAMSWKANVNHHQVISAVRSKANSPSKYSVSFFSFYPAAIVADASWPPKLNRASARFSNAVIIAMARKVPSESW